MASFRLILHEKGKYSLSQKDEVLMGIGHWALGIGHWAYLTCLRTAISCYWLLVRLAFCYRRYQRMNTDERGWDGICVYLRSSAVKKILSHNYQ